MAVTLITPRHSFVRFNETGTFQHPIFGTVTYCLSIFDELDTAFQFVLQGDTKAETDALLDLSNTLMSVGIAENCGAANLLTFAERPERFRLSDTQVLYNWRHGVPDFETVRAVGECFVIKISILGNTWCSNCFERIGDADFSSVIEYGNDENAFGFNYCSADPVDPSTAITGCDPTIITVNNQSFLQVPYTALLQSKHGDAPTIQTWMYDSNGALVNAGITAILDNIPPTMLSWDFGGPFSGIIIIK